MPKTTWKPHEKHGQLTTQSDLPDSVYAFPKQRKEPLTDAQHVRNAVARFDQLSMSPMPIVLWHSRTSRKLRNTTASTSQKRRGTTWARSEAEISTNQNQSLEEETEYDGHKRSDCNL